LAEHSLDCKGLNCPMPIVRISQKLRTMESGDVLVIEASDPAFKADIQAWAKRFGHEIVSFESGAVCRATIVKA
jgi:tRNA 2-thiouridine synthesizing protein A